MQFTVVQSLAIPRQENETSNKYSAASTAGRFNLVESQSTKECPSVLGAAVTPALLHSRTDRRPDSPSDYLNRQSSGKSAHTK